MTRRKASFIGLVVAVASLFAAVPAAWSQQVVKLGEGETLTISGFVNATLFNDRGSFAGGFSNGQSAEWAALVQPPPRQGIFDGDVRNTRINFTFAGPPVIGKWAPKATIEADFFGAFNGVPPNGDEQPQLRLRFAFVDLTNGRTTLRIGQYWSPMFGETGVSLTHIAFPLGYGAAGDVGWRFPGVFLYHDLTPGKPWNFQLQVAAMKGSGPIAAGNPIDAAGQVGIGEASGIPQIETRLNVAHKFSNVSWTGYAVYHVDWKNPTGTGTNGALVPGWGYETGHRVEVSGFTLHGNFYYGKSIGQQFGHITQQNLGVRGWGAWAQAGYDFTPHWSLWEFYGMDQPDYGRYNQETGLTLLRQLNHDNDVLLRFRAGRYAVGLEYFRAVTRWSTAITNADQYALSVLYNF